MTSAREGASQGAAAAPIHPQSTEQSTTSSSQAYCGGSSSQPGSRTNSHARASAAQHETRALLLPGRCLPANLKWCFQVPRGSSGSLLFTEPCWRFLQWSNSETEQLDELCAGSRLCSRSAPRGWERHCPARGHLAAGSPHRAQGWLRPRPFPCRDRVRSQSPANARPQNTSPPPRLSVSSVCLVHK